MTQALAVPKRFDTLALRLFVLMWLALVLSHMAAFFMVTSLHQRPPQPMPGLASPGQPAARAERPPGPPPVPTFGTLPPGDLPLAAQLLDYGVRLVLIAAAAWWGSRWLARPVSRLVSASSALGPALARGEPVELLDEAQGTAEVRAAAGVFNQMATQIIQQFKARGLMIAAISHDLRTPLTRMRMRAETAPLPPEHRLRFVSDLHEMNGLIDTVLEVFRHNQEAVAVSQRTDLMALLLALTDDRVEAGAQVTLAGTEAVVTTDPLALRRVVGNLVDNALRYAGAAEVRVSRAPDEKSVHIQVLDRGPGIPADQLQAVREPFTRLDASRHSSGGGVGLGLYIAEELARRIDGQLRLSARAGGGLMAELVLPLR